MPPCHPTKVQNTLWSRLLDLVETGLTIIEEKKRQIAARIDLGERIADVLQFRALFESNAS